MKFSKLLLGIIFVSFALSVTANTDAAFKWTINVESPNNEFSYVSSTIRACDVNDINQSYCSILTTPKLPPNNSYVENYSTMGTINIAYVEKVTLYHPDGSMRVHKFDPNICRFNIPTGVNSFFMSTKILADDKTATCSVNYFADTK